LRLICRRQRGKDFVKARINFASGFEAATQVREHNLPTFAETIPFTHI